MWCRFGLGTWPRTDEIIGKQGMPFHPQAEACGKGMVAESVIAQSMMLPIAARLQPAVGRDNNTR